MTSAALLRGEVSKLWKTMRAEMLVRLKQAEARERRVLANSSPLQARASVVYLPASKSEFADLGTIESEQDHYQWLSRPG